MSEESGRQAAEWVRALPEETPSLAWRAALNEKVRAEAERRAKRRRRWSFATPAIGLATALLAFAVLLPRPAAAPHPSGRLEAGLLALHQETVETADSVGSGLRPSEAPTTVVLAHDPLDDLDAGVL